MFGGIKKVLKGHLCLIFICFSLCHLSKGNDSDTENKSLHTQVARDLFGSGGLFYTNQDFMSVYFEAVLNPHPLPNDNRVNLLMTHLMSPDTLQILGKIGRLQKRLINHSEYRKHFRTQMKLALSFGINHWDSYKLSRHKKLALREIIWHERRKHSAAALFLGMISVGALSSLSMALGAPIVVTQLAPVVGLPVTAILWKRLLAVPLTQTPRQELKSAEVALRENIRPMGDNICQELKIPLISKIKLPKELPVTTVIKLAELADGSPLLVTLSDILSALQFRNSLTVYKGRKAKLSVRENSLSYPSGEIQTDLGIETHLKEASVYTSILIPVDFRMGAIAEDHEQKLEILQRALSQVLNNQTLHLKHPTANPPICEPLIAIVKPD